VEEILLISFYRIVDTCLVCEDGLTKLCNGVQMAFLGDFLRPVFSASCVQHISDIHSKFALMSQRVEVW